MSACHFPLSAADTMKVLLARPTDLPPQKRARRSSPTHSFLPFHLSLLQKLYHTETEPNDNAEAKKIFTALMARLTLRV